MWLSALTNMNIHFFSASPTIVQDVLQMAVVSIYPARLHRNRKMIKQCVTLKHKKNTKVLIPRVCSQSNYLAIRISCIICDYSSKNAIFSRFVYFQFL